MSVRTVARARHAPLIMSGVVVVLTLALLPFSGHRLGPTTSFVPALLAAVACFDVMSVWLLAGDYLDTGDRRILAMAAAYLWSLLLMAGYALAFPGVFGTSPPLAVAPSVAPYLYIGWHVGFPALLGLAWWPWPRLDLLDVERVERPRLLVWVLAVTAIVSVAAVAIVVAWIRHLPVLIVGLDTRGMVAVTAPVGIPLVVLALIVSFRGSRGRRGPERWAFVAILVCLCDLTLTYAARYRFSLGWYAGRTLTGAAAAVVLVAMLASFRRLKSQAEINAAYDYLTGLPNRRSAYDVLSSMVARSARMQTELAVLMFDIDHFKRVNDEYGHASGDAVLRAVGAAVHASVRKSDIPARIGGEEFVVVLPDTNSGGAQVTADRIRVALSAVKLPNGLAITASFGIAVVAPGDAGADPLMQRADAAMYLAKQAGRDRVWVADALMVSEARIAPGAASVPGAATAPGAA